MYDYSKDFSLLINLTDHCNLNCKGCLHYCNVAPKKFLSFFRLVEDLGIIAMATQEINTLELMGGEPFLHNQLDLVLEFARSSFKNIKDLLVITNGTKILEARREVTDALARTGAIVRVTKYPIILDQEKIKKFAEDKKFNLIFDCDVVTGESVHDNGAADRHWMKVLLDPKGRQDPVEMHNRCWLKHCRPMLDANQCIWKCSKAAYSHYLNERFGTNFKTSDDDFVSIYEVNFLDKVINMTKRPSSFCKYCKVPLDKKDAYDTWKISNNPSASEYIDVEDEWNE